MKPTMAQLQSQYDSWYFRSVYTDDLVGRLICKFNLWRLKMKIGDVQTTEDDGY